MTAPHNSHGHQDCGSGEGLPSLPAEKASLRAGEDQPQAEGERPRRTAAEMLLCSATDPLTGARMRAAGLTELEHEIDRSRRTRTGLVATYVDVVGVEARNDSDGRVAGDALLRRVAGAMRDHLRSYDLVIRLGGDEFLCAMSGMSRPEARRRFRLVSVDLAADEPPSAIAAGFAVLLNEDTASGLMNRADRDLAAERSGTALGRHARPPA